MARRLRPGRHVDQHVTLFTTRLAACAALRIVGSPDANSLYSQSHTSPSTCRWLSSGEYIQMSGRAGRRGLDDKGEAWVLAAQVVALGKGCAAPAVGAAAMEGFVCALVQVWSS